MDEAIRLRRSEQLPLLEQLGSAYDLVAGAPFGRVPQPLERKTRLAGKG